MARGIWCGSRFNQDESLLATYIAHLKKWQATRIHIWLNDNAPPDGFKFDPQNPGWSYSNWREPDLDWGIDRLKGQFDIVLTLSPWYCRKDYLSGLSKPFDLASKYSVKLEFDLEGNCQDAFLEGLGPYKPDLTTTEADAFILGLLDKHYPDALFGITSNTTPRYSVHPALLARSTFVTPQAYGVGEVTTFNAFFAKPGFYKGELWFGVEAGPSVMPSFAPNIVAADNLEKANPQVHGHVVWWDRGLMSAPDEACSQYLSANPPRQS